MSDRKEQVFTTGAVALAAHTCVMITADLAVVTTGDTALVAGVTDYAYAVGEKGNFVTEGPVEITAGGAFDLGSGVALAPTSAGKMAAAVSGDIVCAVADIPVYDSSGALVAAADGNLVPVTLLRDKTRVIA